MIDPNGKISSLIKADWTKFLIN